MENDYSRFGIPAFHQQRLFSQSSEISMRYRNDGRAVEVIEARYEPTPLVQAKAQASSEEEGIELHISTHDKLPTNIDFEKVTTLEFFFNKVVTDTELAEFLKKTPNLRVLELKHSSLSLAGAKLPPFLKVLKVLDLKFNRALTDSILASALKNCDQLERLFLGVTRDSFANMQLPDTLIELELQDCDNVTDTTLMHMTANCKELRALKLSLCSKIKLENVQFRSNLTTLRIYSPMGNIKKNLINSLLNVNMNTLNLVLPHGDKDLNPADIKAEVRKLQMQKKLVVDEGLAQNSSISEQVSELLAAIDAQPTYTDTLSTYEYANTQDTYKEMAEFQRFAESLHYSKHPSQRPSYYNSYYW